MNPIMQVLLVKNVRGISGWRRNLILLPARDVHPGWERCRVEVMQARCSQHEHFHLKVMSQILSIYCV